MHTYPEGSYPHQELTKRIIACAIEVHRTLGPGLLEHFYTRALAIEMGEAGLRFEQERLFNVHYKGHPIGRHPADFDVEERVLVEAKAVEQLAPKHIAIAQSYSKASRRSVLLLLNFDEFSLKDGIRRLVFTGDRT
ncbi:MAG: GxxExxY protein [Planctomycetes bacterium]|nr:GxxExxY protein [Planctomycetota bacterium]